jgi:hypothetical protein
MTDRSPPADSPGGPEGHRGRRRPAPGGTPGPTPDPTPDPTPGSGAAGPDRVAARAGRPPRTRRKRIVGVDAAWGFALLGVIATYVLPEETDQGEPTLLWSLGAGVAAALFTFLAGVSLSLTTGGCTPRTGRSLNGCRSAAAVRAGLMVLLGMLLAILNPPAGILLAYLGVMILMAIPLMGAGAELLWALAGVAVVVGSVFVHATEVELPSLRGFDPTVGTLLTQPDATLSTLFVTGTYPAVAWVAFLTAGMAAGRLNLGLRDTQLRLMVGGLVTAGVAWATSAIALTVLDGYTRILVSTPDLDEGLLDAALAWGPTENTPEITSGWWLFAPAPYSETPLELLSVMGWCIAVFGVLLLVGGLAPAVLSPLALLGTMPLSLYTLHLLFISTPLLATVPALSFWVQAGVAVLLVVLWRNTTKWTQGPLEWVLAACARSARRRYLATGPAP